MNPTEKNPPAIIDSDSLTVRRTVDIEAPRHKVWQTVTDPTLVAQWFGRLELTGEGEGAEGIINFPGYNPIPISIAVFTPETEVAYRWATEGEPASSAGSNAGWSVFTFTLEDSQDGTRLTVVEAGFGGVVDPGREMESHREGWDSELDKLVALLAAPA